MASIQFSVYLNIKQQNASKYLSVVACSRFFSHSAELLFHASCISAVVGTTGASGNI